MIETAFAVSTGLRSTGCVHTLSQPRRRLFACASTVTDTDSHLLWTRRAFLASAAALAGSQNVADEFSRAAEAGITNDVLYDSTSGSFLPPSSLTTLLKRDRGSLYQNVIIASEIHDNSRTHAAQLAVLEAVRKMNGDRPLVVGFEQFWRAHDPFLEQYTQGDIGLEALLRVTQWGNTWGYDSALYAPIFRWCRVHRVKMVGLNVPRRLVSFVSEFGLKNLTPELRAFLPVDIDTSNEAHFVLFMRLLGLSPHLLNTRGADMREMVWKWYEAQVTWDEYMSETCMNALNNDPGAKLVALIGTGHVEGRVGFPNRIERRTGERPYTIVPRPVGWVKSEGLPMPDIEKPERGVADIVWYTNRKIDLV